MSKSVGNLDADPVEVGLRGHKLPEIGVGVADGGLDDGKVGFGQEEVVYRKER